jgi:hypothetical protein
MNVERRRALAVVWMALAALLGVAATMAKSSSEPDKNALTFTYHRVNGDNYISQTLSIKNSNRESVVPELSFTALDRDGHRLPGVQVGTVYGSDSGRLVVPRGWGYDILRFSGSGEHEVYDVRVTVAHLAAAKVRPGIHPLTTQPLDAAGRAVSRFSRFTAVRVTNTDAFAVSVRVAYLVYDQPAEGETQQAISVTPIGGLVRVPADGTAVVEVTGDAAQAVARYSGGPAVSVKAYNSE